MPDYTYLARQQLELQKEANAPAVSSYQASLPEISQKYAQERTRLEGERQPLRERYQQILNDLGRREKVEPGRVSRDVSREYGRRGIPLSSGAFETNLTEQLNPITEYYAGQAATTGLERERGLQELTNLASGLTTQETEQSRAVQNAMAQLQAGSSREAIANALQQFQLQQQAQQFGQELGFKQQQLASDLALRQASESRAAQLQGYNLETARQQDPIQLALLQQQLQQAQQATPLNIDLLRSQLSGEQLKQAVTSAQVPLELQKARSELSYAEQARPLQLEQLRAQIAGERALAGQRAVSARKEAIPDVTKTTSYINTQNAANKLKELIESVPSGEEKLTVQRYLSSIEPSAQRLGLDMDQLWAIYNGLP